MGARLWRVGCARQVQACAFVSLLGVPGATCRMFVERAFERAAGVRASPPGAPCRSSVEPHRGWAPPP